MDFQLSHSDYTDMMGGAEPMGAGFFKRLVRKTENVVKTVEKPKNILAIATGGTSLLLPKTVQRKIVNAAKTVGKPKNVLAIATGGTSLLLPKTVQRKIINVVKNPGNLAVALTAIPTAGLSLLAKKNVRKAVVHTIVKDSKAVAHGAATAARFVGHEVAQADRVIERVARRIIMALAHKLLFKKSGMSGDAPDVPILSRTHAKEILLPAATAAVAAQAPAAAPAVPILVNSVIDELYNAVQKKISTGKSPDDAAAEVQKEVSGTIPKWAYYAAGSALVLGVGIFAMRKRN